MADEAVVESPEQAPVETPQVEDATPVEASEEVVAEEGVSDGAESVEPEAVVAETPEAEASPEPEPEIEPEPTPSLTWEEIREQYKEQIASERNTAAQEREQKLRRDLGNQEETKAFLKARAQELGIETDDDRVSFALKNNQDFGMNRAFVALGTGAAESLQLDGAEKDALMSLLDSTDPAETYRGAQRLVALAVERQGVPIGRQEVLEMSVDDLPEDSALAKSVQAHAKQRAGAAVKAAKLEAQPAREPAPEVAVGQVVGSDGEAIDPTKDQASNARAFNLGLITASEYATHSKKHGVPVS